MSAMAISTVAPTMMIQIQRVDNPPSTTGAGVGVAVCSLT
jgi:hypothetical protein